MFGNRHDILSSHKGKRTRAFISCQERSSACKISSAQKTVRRCLCWRSPRYTCRTRGRRHASRRSRRDYDIAAIAAAVQLHCSSGLVFQGGSCCTAAAGEFQGGRCGAVAASAVANAAAAQFFSGPGLLPSNFLSWPKFRPTWLQSNFSSWLNLALQILDV